MKKDIPVEFSVVEDTEGPTGRWLLVLKEVDGAREWVLRTGISDVVGHTGLQEVSTTTDGRLIVRMYPNVPWRSLPHLQGTG